MQAHRRHDTPDQIREILKPHLPGCKGRVGRPAGDNRLFINVVFLDTTDRSTMARLAAGLWRPEKYTSPFLSLAR
jgi:hypothetical protein